MSEAAEGELDPAAALRVTPAAFRAARVLTGWSVRDMVRLGRISPNTISMLEQGVGEPRPSTVLKVVRLFESAGLVFIVEPGWTGVRRRIDP